MRTDWIKQGETVTVTVEGGSEEANAAVMEQFFKEMEKAEYMVKGDRGGTAVDIK